MSGMMHFLGVFFFFDVNLQKSTVMLSDFRPGFGNGRHRSGGLSCHTSDISANDVARLSHKSKREKKKKSNLSGYG